MHIRKKFLRSAVLVLCFIFLMTSLSACQVVDLLAEKRVENILSSNRDNDDDDEEDDDEESGEDGENNKSDEDDKNHDEQEIEVESLSADEIFNQTTKQTLLDVVEKSDQIASAQLTLLFSPEEQFSNEDSDYKRVTTDIINPEDGETISIITESIIDSTSGDSSMTVELQSGSETASSSGIYFTGDQMLIQKSDPETPMIQHTIDSEVSNSYKGIPAIDRLNRVLTDDSEIKMNNENWSDAIDSYLAILNQNAQEEDYLLENNTIDVAEMQKEVDQVTLTLTGENAVTATREFVLLLAKDPTLESYFVTLNYTDSENEEYDVTGLEGVLRDLDALSSEEQTGLNTTFVVQMGSEVTSLRLTSTTGSKTMEILFKFFENGYINDDEIIFKGFDGSAVTMTALNIEVGENQYAGTIFYETVGPGGDVQESSSILNDSSIVGDQYDSSVQLSYTNASFGEEEPIEISGEFDFSQQKVNDEIAGTAEGAIDIISDGETNTMNISVTLEQNNESHEVLPPMFIEGSGVSTSDRASLFTALENEELMDDYNKIPISMRSVIGLMMIM